MYILILILISTHKHHITHTQKNHAHENHTYTKITHTHKNHTHTQKSHIHTKNTHTHTHHTHTHHTHTHTYTHIKQHHQVDESMRDMSSFERKEHTVKSAVMGLC